MGRLVVEGVALDEKNIMSGVGVGGDFFFFFMSRGSKITFYVDCSHEMKRHLLLGRKSMTKVDSILKSSGITLLTRIRRVKTGFYSSHIWM